MQRCRLYQYLAGRIDRSRCTGRGRFWCAALRVDGIQRCEPGTQRGSTQEEAMLAAYTLVALLRGGQHSLVAAISAYDHHHHRRRHCPGVVQTGETCLGRSTWLAQRRSWRAAGVAFDFDSAKAKGGSSGRHSILHTPPSKRAGGGAVILDNPGATRLICTHCR